MKEIEREREREGERDGFDGSMVLKTAFNHFTNQSLYLGSNTMSLSCILLNTKAKYVAFYVVNLF